VAVSQRLRLVLHRIGKFPAAIADVDTPQSCQPVDITMTIDIFDPYAVAFRHDDWRSLLLVITKCGERMKMVVTIQFGEVDVFAGESILGTHSVLNICARSAARCVSKALM
jgi:hypothetical protein